MCLTLQNWTFRVLHTGNPASDRCSNFQLEDWFPSACSTTKDAYRPWADIHRTAVCKKTSQVVSEATCYALLRSWDRRGKKAIAEDRWAAEENFRLIGLMDASATGGPIFCMGRWNLPLWQPWSKNIEVRSDIQSSKVQVGLGFGRMGGGSVRELYWPCYCKLLLILSTGILFQYLAQGSGLHHWFFLNGSRDTACALGAKRAVSI
jgi:hypothetical protein